MNVLTYFLYWMMLIVILVSAAVTYRLILHERAMEIGVMRVIGFSGKDLYLVLWTEIIVLGFISMVVGFFIARILSFIVSLLSFSWFPGFEIFLKDGRLKTLLLPSTMLINTLSVFVVLVMLGLVPSFRASLKKLPKLLSGEPF